MARIRNISPDTLTIGYGFPGPRTVEPDGVIDVPDDVVSAYVDRVDGITDPATGQHQLDENGVPMFNVVPSDLWAPVDGVPAPPVDSPAPDVVDVPAVEETQ